MAELVPGISGGTVALIVGIYEKALHTGNALIDAVRTRSREALRAVDWPFLIAVGVGMLGAIFLLSGVIHSFVEGQPQVSKALFLGMVAASLSVPLRMIGLAEIRRRSLVLAPVFLLCAALSFLATGFTSEPVDNPSLIVVFFAAMIAVCALVLPGLSGSFLLLAMGLYQPVMGSLSDREWSVIVVFALGAMTGLVAFVKVLDKMMRDHHTMTLTVMAGLMLGSLRALWPWETVVPGTELSVWIALLIGASIVTTIIVVGNKKEKQ
ncbi:DUF368 domain-containing protein [Corynebacterium lowii]|nr:DUF368 domain-containing protein [Corynebacterium lowii]MDP9850931.1 putative membrane protein [Corynebacterium lowii]